MSGTKPVLVALIIAAFAAPGCRPVPLTARSATPQPASIAAPPSVDEPNENPLIAQPANYPGLNNVVEYAPGVYSGSAPEADTGFDALVSLGIHTIVSVDGAVPDLERARVRGLRYVHLPIGYDGTERIRALQIARAIRDLPGPTYVHCHHGKHRSAAAAGAALVALGRLTPEQARQYMRVSGTSPAYRGLFACVATAAVASAEELQAAGDAFPETWQKSDFVQAMVDIDAAFDHLKSIEKAGWRTPPDHPDLVPAAEAGRLADLLRNLSENPDASERPAEFVEWLRDASMRAQELESSLANGDSLQRSPLLSRVSDSCRVCHAKYRD